MEDAQETYSQEFEVRGMDVHSGIEVTNSNGHGDEKEEDINMAKTIKKLQVEVHSHKPDNERIMKAKEQWEDFNMKLMKILDKIEKNLYK
jgi:hypothetical protein